MRYSELAEAARGNIGPHCKACPTCDGNGCLGKIPGPGACGGGKVAVRNREAWADYRLNLDCIHGAEEPDCSCELFGRTLSLPVLAGPIGDVTRHYGDRYGAVEYNRVELEGCRAAGTLGMTGDAADGSIFEGSCALISELGGWGIPTVKPWEDSVLEPRLVAARACGAPAVCMDVDSVGLKALRLEGAPAVLPRTTKELGRVIRGCGLPFIVKGVMTAAGAEKAAAAGAEAIVVSNHGGRVLDGVPATAEVLPSIVDAVGSDVTILVDGGIRSGIDVFRALALGADACIVARPVVVAAYGGGAEGVSAYLGQLADELCDAMLMCGAGTLDDIDEDLLFF